MSLARGQIVVEQCSAPGSPKVLHCARTRIADGPEGLRFAYDPDPDEARKKLEAILRRENCKECSGTGVVAYGGIGVRREMPCECMTEEVAD